MKIVKAGLPSLVILTAGLSIATSVVAAPLDAFLTAKPYSKEEFVAEAAFDAVNSTIDVLGIRAKDPQLGGTTVGDYSGYHVRGGYGLTERLSLEGGLWKRNITYLNDVESINSWDVAAQYRLGSDYGAVNYAVRMGAWGNDSNVLNKTTPTKIIGKTLQTIAVTHPKDVQYQADLIATWAVSNRLDWSAFVGGGVSDVSVAGMSGTATSGGCNFNVNFSSTTATLSLASPCGGLLSMTTVTPFSALQEVSYKSNFYQLGSGLQWHNEDWRLRGGYYFQRINRNAIDALITSRKGVAYNNNHMIIAEIDRKVSNNSAVFVRAQIMSNQFVGEIPFAYNTVTASKFGRTYGFASFGMMMRF